MELNCDDRLQEKLVCNGRGNILGMEGRVSVGDSFDRLFGVRGATPLFDDLVFFIVCEGFDKRKLFINGVSSFGFFL